MAVARGADESVTPQEVADRLAPLIERGLLLKDGGRYLALAIPVGAYVPSAATLDRVNRAIRAPGRAGAPVTADSRELVVKRVDRRSA